MSKNSNVDPKTKIIQQSIVYNEMPNLRETPKCKAVICGKKRFKCRELDINQIPAPARLSVKRPDKLDDIKAMIPKPKNIVPPTSMPSWKEMPMDMKIPLLPVIQKYLCYSRGKVGSSLIRRHPFFNLNDNKNVGTNSYSALHDPHVKDYFNKPSVRKLLKKQGLVNEKREVICSVKEFNEFRSYLGAQYNDKVKAALSSRDRELKVEREQLKSIKEYEMIIEPQQYFDQWIDSIQANTERKWPIQA